MPGSVSDAEEQFTQAFRETVRLHCDDWPEEAAPLNPFEGFRQSLRLTSAGHLQFLESDPAYPLLVKNQSLQRQMQLPAADAVYHWTKVDGRFNYRLRGDRGSAHIFQIALYEGSSSRYPDFTVVSTSDSLDNPELAPEKMLDIRLSRDSDLYRLPEGGGELFIRQYYYDWNTEQPATLWIEREGADYPPPPLEPQTLSAGADDLVSWLKVQSNVYRTYMQAILDKPPSPLEPFSIPGAFEGAWYMNGPYRCAPDEAVVLEVDAPDAPYWSFQLGNLQWEALDYYVRKTSINGHQAVLGADGKFRAVISHKDPGVPNWLDAGGRELGIIAGRYFRAKEAPAPTLRTVSFAELERHLPPHQARVSLSERREELRNRLVSAHNRFCSDQ